VLLQLVPQHKRVLPLAIQPVVFLTWVILLVEHKEAVINTLMLLAHLRLVVLRALVKATMGVRHQAILQEQFLL
jgi:hypothetical protein